MRLDQAVDDLLPELADRRVLRALDAELDDTVPAERPITVEDLLSFRFGFGSVMAPPGSYPIQRAEAELGSRASAVRRGRPVAHDVDSWIAALGSLPLMYQPGEQWLYNTSAQVLGVLLARLRPGPVETVMRERIFEPLGMTDTGFTVPADQRHRLTTAYRPIRETGELVGARRPREQLVEHAAVVPRRQRLAGLDHRRLLVVRLDGARRRHGATAGASSRRNRWRS